MWKPFTRRDEQPEGASSGSPLPSGPPSDHSPPEPIPAPRASIAEVELIGQTAVATLTVTELSQEVGAEQLADLLCDLAETGAMHYVLDVQCVQYMDTACLGVLVEALNRMAARGGRIAVVNPNHSVHYIFRLTRLDRVFSICSDVMSALEAVDRTREAG
jgi:anti-sigma B factor antagonist